jgi:hypothetical protein
LTDVSNDNNDKSPDLKGAKDVTGAATASDESSRKVEEPSLSVTEAAADKKSGMCVPFPFHISKRMFNFFAFDFPHIRSSHKHNVACAQAKKGSF